MTIYLENNSVGHGQYSLTACDIELCLGPLFKMLSNRIGGVMVSMLKPKTMKLVYVVLPLSIKEKEQRLVGPESE